MALKPVYSLPLTSGGTLASKSSHDAEINRVIGELYALTLGGSSQEAQEAAETAMQALEAIQEASRSAVTYEYIATAGQTVFTGADSNGAVLAAANVYSVFHEGSLVPSNSAVFTADGTVLTFGYPTLAGDSITIVANSFAPTHDSYQYPGLTAASIVKPPGFIWNLQTFGNAKLESGKPQSTQSWIEILSEALNSDETINVPAGVYPIREKMHTSTGLNVANDIGVDVRCSGNATFLLELDTFSGGLIDARSLDVVGPRNRVGFKWEGGRFNATGVVGDTATGITLFDVYNRYNPQIIGIDCFGVDAAGLYTPKIDTWFTFHNCYGGSVRHNMFAGSIDVAVYLSGNNIDDDWDGIGEEMMIFDNSFSYYNGIGVALKRDFIGAKIIGNRFFRGASGVQSSPTDGSLDNHGNTSLIQGNRFIQMEARPVQLIGGRDSIVCDNLIEDFGHQRETPATPTGVESFNHVAGIDLRGVTDGIVHHNTIRLREWAGSTADSAAKAVVGIRLGEDLENNFSTGCKITENTIGAVHRPFLEDSGCSYNELRDNTVTKATAGTALTSSVLGTGTVNKPAEKMYSLINDPTFVASGGELVVTIPAADVKKGDIVSAWIGNRQAGDPGVNALAMKAICADGQIDIILTNNSASPADLDNTLFNALARPTI